MQYYHKYRSNEYRRYEPCGGLLVDTGQDDGGERQYRCEKCGETGNPLTDGEDTHSHDSPIFLEGTEICVCQLLLPHTQFRDALRAFMARNRESPLE